ncbi:MAG TPA: BMP family ABC transporter substrate-binding protein [Aeromicrobium sp.]|nr:BMP family ABC transporter substrate-binding protein [Aeromicrobium sp.]HKY58866.1 BMP family ABC transporter substrate-binding protein [Aeromicrobium sp.]
MRWIALLLTGALVAGCGTPQSTKDPELTVGFVFIADQRDLGYSQAIWEASEALARAMPDIRVLRTPGIPEEGGAAEEAMEAQIRRGASVVFATSYGYRDAAYRVARRHPDVVVLHQGGLEKTPRLDNFGTYWGTMEEPVYLAGIVAGSATKSGRVGLVASFPIPAVFNDINAFLLGARVTRPDATEHVRFVGSWCDPKVQRRAAEELLAAGVDVITQHLDCTRPILETAEQAGINSIGFHLDGSEAAPRGYLVGSVWNWTDLLVDAVRIIRRGEFKESKYNGDFRGGLATGDNPFVLSEITGPASPETRELVADAEARMRSGWSPFTGPIVDRDGRVRQPDGVKPKRSEIDHMDYVIEGVVGTIPPH